MQSVAIIEDKLTGDSGGLGFVEMPNKEEVGKDMGRPDEPGRERSAGLPAR